jgi:hypothetical protein
VWWADHVSSHIVIIVVIIYVVILPTHNKIHDECVKMP